MIPWHWYVPAGVLESIGWIILIWISWRFCKDLMSNPFENSRREIYVRSETTGWEGWTEIDIKK